MTHLSKRNFIVAAALAMVTRAWADEAPKCRISEHEIHTCDLSHCPGGGPIPAWLGDGGNGFDVGKTKACARDYTSESLYPKLTPLWECSVDNIPGLLIEGECVKGGGGGSGRVPPTSTTGTEYPVAYPCPPLCVAGGGPALSSPKCDPGYALLAYPGTWTLVCARDLQAPK